MSDTIRRSLEPRTYDPTVRRATSSHWTGWRERRRPDGQSFSQSCGCYWCGEGKQYKQEQHRRERRTVKMRLQHDPDNYA
jgi:hypothetical protein